MRLLGKTNMNIKRVGFGGIPITKNYSRRTFKVIDELENKE